MKTYQVNSAVIVLADGWVKAKNKREAGEKWKAFCLDEMRGVSTAGVEIHDLMSPRNKSYDKASVPTDEDFAGDDCITHSFLN